MSNENGNIIIDLCNNSTLYCVFIIYLYLTNSLLNYYYCSTDIIVLNKLITNRLSNNNLLL